MDAGIVLETNCALTADVLTGTPVTVTLCGVGVPNHWWPSHTIRYWGK
jgi:hypothetical protein